MACSGLGYGFTYVRGSKAVADVNGTTPRFDDFFQVIVDEAFHANVLHFAQNMLDIYVLLNFILLYYIISYIILMLLFLMVN